MDLQQSMKRLLLPVVFAFNLLFVARGQPDNAKFHVIAFYTAKSDLAHISFVHEANRWFSKTAAVYGFTYDSTSNWNNLNNDVRNNPDIQILLSIDSISFPLGTGPKQHEIWHSGYYPVVWTNRNYRMLYINMGHNDIDYESGTNKELSFTFGYEIQDRLIIDALLWLGGDGKR